MTPAYIGTFGMGHLTFSVSLDENHVLCAVYDGLAAEGFLYTLPLKASVYDHPGVAENIAFCLSLNLTQKLLGETELPVTHICHGNLPTERLPHLQGLVARKMSIRMHGIIANQPDAPRTIQ